MLLKQLIESPKTSSKLLICDPFREYDHEELVKEVIGLANADVDGPRNILFGVNSGALEGGGIVGITDDAMADFKKAHRLISAMIEPVLHLSFIYDRINGKLVGTLEIDGCDNGPYIVGQDYSNQLSRGECWIREGWELRAVRSADLAETDKPEPTKKPTKKGKPPAIAVGFNEQAECSLLEMDVPDTSNPPFAGEKRKTSQPGDLKKTIKEKIGTVTTQILRMGGIQKKDVAGESDKQQAETQSDESVDAESLIADADNHYFFEEKALKLNLSVCNKGTEGIENVRIKLGFPKLPDFDVADHIYVSPFDKRSQYDVKKMGYPEVERRDGAIMVCCTLDHLAPDSPKQAFKCALRLAVGPRMQRRKIAIRYSLRDQDEQSLGKGRLKIKFGKTLSCEDEGEDSTSAVA